VTYHVFVLDANAVARQSHRALDVVLLDVERKAEDDDIAAMDLFVRKCAIVLVAKINTTILNIHSAIFCDPLIGFVTIIRK
jgi:hypothetical protein